MAHTNRGRVVLGGLLAGVVINIVEYVVNGVILKADWANAMQAMGKSPVISGKAIMIFNIWGFLAGIAAVWIYAAIRSRYGAGPGTAMRAGLAAWFLASFLVGLANYPLGLFSVRLIVLPSLAELIAFEIATIFGAWIYKEGETTAVRSAAA
ncbi:MAG TPA: hypothetical protein VMB18_04910 [Terriglobales bacterium]|nr:hypothetical protein [Terriglobales bacterium]